MRLTWLADELRAAGLKVVEVDGWKTRGSDEFQPEGVTWHATAGSRTGTAQGEVSVILHGSETAPPPIAQLMLWRDGTLYVCAAGRCNHNKVGWDGPNKGLGNTRLLGIEMANDNRGEPWPAVQLDAARRATAAIMRHLKADPMKRLAAHYEHQPYATRPPGESSTKSDPAGVDMKAERPRVAALMKEDDVTPEQLRAAVKAELTAAVDDIARGVWEHKLDIDVSGTGVNMQPAGGILRYNDFRAARSDKAIALANDRIAALNTREAAEVPPTADETAQAVVDAIAAGTPEQTAAALKAVLGDQAPAVGRLLAQ